MAARTRKVRHDEFTRERIQTTQLVKRLTGHALGELRVEMSPSQVTAALGLLKKILPDLQATTIAGDPNAPLKLDVLTPEEKQARAAALLGETFAEKA